MIFWFIPNLKNSMKSILWSLCISWERIKCMLSSVSVLSTKKQFLYLGHIISQESVAMDHVKIRSIEDWPTPRNLTEVRSFIGLPVYYRIYKEEISWIANPIISLQKNGVKFIESWKCEESFRLLKGLLPRDLVLKLPHPYKYYVVCANASLEGLGGVLMQDGHVIFYELVKLKQHEKNYVVHDL